MERAKEATAAPGREEESAWEAEPGVSGERKKVEVRVSLAKDAVGTGRKTGTGDLADEGMAFGGVPSSDMDEVIEPAKRPAAPAVVATAPKPGAMTQRAREQEEVVAGKGMAGNESFDSLAEDDTAGEASTSGPEGSIEDEKSLVKKARALELSGQYQEALELYERKLALLGYGQDARRKAARADTSKKSQPAPPAEAAKTPAGTDKDQEKRIACTPQLRSAVKGASRCYQKLDRKAEALALEQWHKSVCKINE